MNGARANKPLHRTRLCRVGELTVSIRMTRHASGWFGRLREPCCGYAAEEATVSGAHSGHGQEGPPMSGMIATAAPYRRSDLSAPISVIRSQKQSGSNNKGCIAAERSGASNYALG
jgi:hypothetical protein